MVGSIVSVASVLETLREVRAGADMFGYVAPAVLTGAIGFLAGSAAGAIIGALIAACWEWFGKRRVSN